MCYRGNSINFQIYEGRVSSPNLGCPLFVLEVLTYISNIFILLFYMRSIVLQVISPVADLI